MRVWKRKINQAKKKEVWIIHPQDFDKSFLWRTKTKMSNEATDSGSKWGKKKNLNVFNEMLHHVCLIPFCIIDMILAKCFLNNWIIYLLSVLPQLVPDLDKKLNSSPFLVFLWDFQGFTGLCLWASRSRDLKQVMDQDEMWSQVKRRLLLYKSSWHH